jgi:two-component system, NarL family, nitrate/nitrite response regulator NarL
MRLFAHNESQNDRFSSSPIQTRMKLLVADDHSLVREGLKTVLTDAFPGTEVVAVDSLPSALDAAKADASISLALLDLNMPGMNGTTSITDFCEACPLLPVIILSGSENPNDINGALMRGAMGYIPKSAPPDVMVSAIKLVRSGGVYVPSALLSERNASGHRMYELTPRQLDVLRLLALGRSNKEVARELDISEGTVKSHVDAILGELAARNRTHAVIVAQQAGLIPA